MRRPLIRAVRPYRDRSAFLRDVARLVTEGGPVRGTPPRYGEDPDGDVLLWPEEVACDGPDHCRADCKGHSIRAARKARDEGRRVELVITTRGAPAHMAVRIDGVLVDESEKAGMEHVPREVFKMALLVSVQPVEGP